MGQFNPFAVLPADVCDDFSLPAFPTDQDCIAYPQRLSQTCAVVVLPAGAPPPVDWTTLAGWDGVIQNDDLTMTKARYLVGIGSFLPDRKVIANLAEQRLEEVKDRGYRLRFKVLNMDAGHRAFGKLLEAGWKDFDVWLETLGSRLIGGPIGMRPVFVDCDFPFDGANNSRENMDITMDFFFHGFPDITDLAFDFGEGPFFWGDPGVPDIWGDPGNNTGWGWPE